MGTSRPTCRAATCSSPRRGRAPRGWPAELQRAIDEELGVECPVYVLSRADLAEVVDGNPFAAPKDPKTLHAIILEKAPDAAAKKQIADAHEQAGRKLGRDEARPVGRVLYLTTPDGYGTSELGKRLLRSSRAKGTARNWSSVTKLLALLDAG